jgi:hypothetical protein
MSDTDIGYHAQAFKLCNNVTIYSYSKYISKRSIICSTDNSIAMVNNQVQCKQECWQISLSYHSRYIGRINYLINAMQICKISINKATIIWSSYTEYQSTSRD